MVRFRLNGWGGVHYVKEIPYMVKQTAQCECVFPIKQQVVLELPSLLSKELFCVHKILRVDCSALLSDVVMDFW